MAGEIEMKKVRIYNTLHHTIDSYGNGWAYELVHKADGRSVFVQNEDAQQFRAEIDAMKAQGWRPSRITSELWSTYEAVASESAE